MWERVKRWMKPGHKETVSSGKKKGKERSTSKEYESKRIDGWEPLVPEQKDDENLTGQTYSTILQQSQNWSNKLGERIRGDEKSRSKKWGATEERRGKGD